MNTYKVVETFINHGRYHPGRELFPSLIFRELCQNLWDSKQENKPTKKTKKTRATQGTFEDIINEPQPRIILSTCTHPTDPNLEYIIAMTNATPFEDAETLESRMRYGVSGVNSGHQGSGIFASGIMASYGDIDAFEVIYLSKGDNNYFGATMRGEKPNIFTTDILTKKETNAWVKHIKELYAIPQVFESKSRSQDAKTQTGKELFEESTVISLFRYSRRIARDKASDNSPVNVVSIGALMAMSEAAQKSKVLFTPSVVFGSEKYEINVAKGNGNELHLATPHNASMKNFSDKECSVALNNVPIVTNAQNNETEYWDFTLRFRKVKYMESSGTRTHPTVGSTSLKTSHYNRMLPISVTLTIDDSKLNEHHCERKTTDPMYIEQAYGCSCFAQQFGFSAVQLKEADKNEKNVLQKMSQLLGFTVEPAKSSSQKRKYILRVFQQIDIIAKPHKDMNATGGIWLDFYAEYPDKITAFLRGIAKECAARENKGDMSQFKLYRSQCNEEIAAVSDAEDFIPYLESKLSKRLGVIQVIPVAITQDKYGDPKDIAIGDPITTLQKVPYGTPRRLDVIFKQAGRFIDPNLLKVRVPGITIDCSGTEGLSIKFARQLKGAMIATLEISPLTFVTNNKKTLVKDEEHFRSLYAPKYVEKPQHYPHRAIKVSYEQNFFNLSYVIDVPSQKPNDENKNKGGSTGHGKPTKGTNSGQKYGKEYGTHDDPTIICVFDANMFKLNQKHHEISQTKSYMRQGDRTLIEAYKKEARILCEDLNAMKDSLDDNVNIHPNSKNENELSAKFKEMGGLKQPGLLYVLDKYAQKLYTLGLQPIIHKMIKQMEATAIQEESLDEAA